MRHRIYYIDDEITSITVEKLPGDFVAVTEEIFKKVMDSPHLYMVVDNKIVVSTYRICKNKTKMVRPN